MHESNSWGFFPLLEMNKTHLSMPIYSSMKFQKNGKHGSIAWFWLEGFGYMSLKSMVRFSTWLLHRSSIQYRGGRTGEMLFVFISTVECTGIERSGHVGWGGEYRNSDSMLVHVHFHGLMRFGRHSLLWWIVWVELESPRDNLNHDSFDGGPFFFFYCLRSTAGALVDLRRTCNG